METDIGKKVFDFIRKNDLLQKGDAVVAGVSGGADSMCMLLLLKELMEPLDLKLTVVHVDHGIRMDEAKGDAAFVESYCRDNGIAFELVSADIPAMAKAAGKTCEEAGRDFRYAYFLECALKHGVKRIAVAHNSGDNAETVLFNIFRGSGISGLKGIVPKRPVDKNKDIFLVRPILCLSRPEIEEFLKEKGQEFRTDSTNSDTAYSRNRIRNEILPLVKDFINDEAERHIASLSSQAADIEDYLNLQTDAAMKYVETVSDGKGDICGVRLDYSHISDFHSVIRLRVIRRAFETVSGRLKDVEEKHIRAIDELYLKQSGKMIDLPYSIKAVKEFGYIYLRKNTLETDERDPGFRTEEENTSFKTDTETSGKISLEIAEREDLKGEIPHQIDIKWFDFEKIGGMPEIRTMRDGDYLLVGKELHR